MPISKNRSDRHYKKSYLISEIRAQNTNVYTLRKEDTTNTAVTTEASGILSVVFI